ncbi:MAG: c-type cytochrome [Lautropia sp.]|nr:c-type cytochrome [Lautropia sp.]
MIVSFRSCVVPLRPLVLAALCAGLLGHAPARAAEFELPPETASYAASPLPGHALAQRHCLTCHSAHYVATQPGTSSHAFWVATVRKMRDVFGASFPEADIEPIADYLSHVYGADRSRHDERLAAVLKQRDEQKAAAGQAGGKQAPADAQALLEENACTACHQVDKKVVGPAFRDVAGRYAGQADALQQLMAHIRDGGSGRWGAVPMPPQPDISQADLETLARWVLEQGRP